MASRLWKDGTRRGIAYVEGRETAERIMELTGRRKGDGGAPPARRTVAPARGDAQEAALTGAMAVYLDRRGRPFAWQIPFDMGQWDAVTALIGDA